MVWRWMTLWIGVLGPLTVRDDDGHIPVPAGKQRTVLAALAMRANQAVTRDELADLVWDERPPASADATLRNYVKHLRHALGSDRLVTARPGYLLRLDERELDVSCFESLLRKADTARHADRWQETHAALTEALSLWRGAPLADIRSDGLHREHRPRLEQMGWQAREDCIEAELRLGRHDRLVPQLQELTAAHPLRERFHAQLMLALARAGRRAEALEAYRRARRTLVDQLGIEPGPELRDLHDRILTGGLAPSAARTPPQAGALPAVPRQLPAVPRYFTGRRSELDTLTRLVDTIDASGGTVVISAIDGMAGIGKTALAVHAAHLLAERFPDGQLFLDLHGYTQGHPPLTANEALNGLLGALGMPPERIPANGGQAAALYRQCLADTRTLIVLDNAATDAQVRPLLPGAGSCLVLVTSRRRLKSLDDARSLSLDLLSPPDAVALLSAVAGPGRIPPDDPLAAEVAGLCGYLPLALRIAASLLRHRPAWSLENLTGQLRDQHRRVGALCDGERGLPAVFDLSYASLEAAHRRLWRLLGLVPGTDLDAHAAAALAQLDPATAVGLLENLVDHNLLSAYAAGRYRLHDLLRAHARALAAADDPASEREAAVDRLLHYYAHTAQIASVAIARYSRPAPHSPAPAHTPALPDRDTARTWLRTEQPNLEAALTHAHTHDFPQHTIALAAGLAEILQADGPWTRALEIHQAATETTERVGHPAARATALIDLGRARQMIGDYPGAGDALTRALDLCRALGDRLGEANALTNLGRVRQMTGDYPAADAALTRALELYRVLGDRLGEANALTDLGRARHQTGDHPGADAALTRALELYRALGHRGNEAWALNHYAATLAAADERPHALALYQQALAMNRELNKPDDEAIALEGIAEHHLATGNLTQGAEHLHQALEIYRRLGMTPDTHRVQNRLNGLTAR